MYRFDVRVHPALRLRAAKILKPHDATPGRTALGRWFHRVGDRLEAGMDRLGDGYGRAYCAMIPGAQFQPIERAGHYPHIEQPEEFARRALAFADSGAKAPAKTSAKAG